MTIRDFLERSSATPAFRDAIRAFVRTGAPNERVGFEAYSPPVKIERTLTKMLAAYPDLAIDRAEIRGSSGCEYFSGKLTITALDGEREVLFHWDCKWRAQQEGWVDYFGFPDQTRAAREFGHECFRQWTEARATQGAMAV